MNDVLPHLIRHIKAAKKDSLEQVQREIDEWKRERELSQGGGTGSPSAQSQEGQSGVAAVSPSASPPCDSFFACSGIDETGYGDELVCICDDEDTAPWQRCPIHDAVTD